MLRRSCISCRLLAENHIKRRFSLSGALHNQKTTAPSPQLKKPPISQDELLPSSRFTYLLENRPSELTPEVVENHIAALLEDRKYHTIWRSMNTIKEGGLDGLVSANLYGLLLKTIKSRLETALIEKQQLVKLAPTLYLEAVSNERFLMTTYQYQGLAFDLLIALGHSDSMADLLALRLVYQNYITKTVNDAKFEIYYLRSYICILLTTDQEERAFELFDQCYHNLSHGVTKADLLKILPTKRLLEAMARTRECDLLSKWLKTIHSDTLALEIPFFTALELLNYLNSGLESYNYGLVKTIYDEMQLSATDSGESVSALLSLTTDSSIFRILQLFATNGDVNLTLQLIEAHFIHKNMKGETALTKELCTLIITSYCYHKDLQSNWDEKEIFQTKQSHDDSVKRVIDIINEMNSKFTKRNDPNSINYRDITNALSFKFKNYKAYDANIERAVAKAEGTSQRMLKRNEELPESESLNMPRKASNPNVLTSKYGNILKNLEVLSAFVTEHATYIIERGYSTGTMTLFLNCLLNHVNLHQNFSGLLRVLMAFKSIDSAAFHQWLDRELFGIILNSLSNSSAAKLCSLELYNHLSGHQHYSLTHSGYHCLVSATLRGGNYRSLMEYYLYVYLKDKGHVNAPTVEILLDIPDKSESLAKLVQFLNRSLDTGTEIFSSEVDRFWREQGLNCTVPTIDPEPDTKSKRPYYHSIDTRDARFLKYLFE